MTDILIVGTGLAATRALVGLRSSGFEGEVTLVGEELHFPYDRPPLSKSVITEEQDPVLPHLLDEQMVSSLKADVRRGVSVDRIEPAAKTVALSTGETIPYKKLLLATGAKPRRLSLPGGEHALLLRNFEDAVALRNKFQAGQRVVIIGGGFIGLELASSASKRGCDVTLIEAQPRILMRGVPEEIARIVHDRHEQAGVTLVTGVGLKSITVDAVHLADGRAIPADVIIAGIGASPDVRLAEQAGLAIDNGIAVNDKLQTSGPDIYAAGDCCSFPHPLYGHQRVRLEAWRNAQDQGNLAAENMLGANKSYAAIPWFWSDQYDLSLQVAGLANNATQMIARKPSTEALLLFHLDAEGKLLAASGIGPGNSIARDIKLAEMLIAKNISPSPGALADPSVSLKALLKG